MNFCEQIIGNMYDKKNFDNAVINANYVGQQTNFIFIIIPINIMVTKQIIWKI